MKILHLTLKKKWFDLILSGEKKEEYREPKSYWVRRLSEFDGETFLYHKDFDIVRFRNGYASNAPMFDIECKRITMDYGNYAGAPGHKCYVIELGKILKRAVEKG